MKPEKVEVHLDPTAPTAKLLVEAFAKIFSSLDAHPRPLHVRVFVDNVRLASVTLDLQAGEPLFRVEGGPDAQACYRRRWLAEHPVPLTFRAKGRTTFLFQPTSGNRVKVIML